MSDSGNQMRLRHVRAVGRLEQARAHDLHAISTTRPSQQQLVALYSAVRDALDILNNLPKEHWRLDPENYRAMVQPKDLGKEGFR